MNKAKHVADIERMAREADPDFGNSDGDMSDALCGLQAIARFAALVRAQALEDAAREAHKLLDVTRSPLVLAVPAAIRALAADPKGVA